jgi:hypothetical protein
MSPSGPERRFAAAQQISRFRSVADDDGVNVSLYHCKSAGGAEPGNRVGDVYEVCAQAAKSIIWCDLPRLVDRLIDRMQRRKGVGRIVRGTVAEMRALATRRPVKFKMIVVQTGITKANLDAKLAEVLAAANSHLVRAGHGELEVWQALELRAGDGVATDATIGVFLRQPSFEPCLFEPESLVSGKPNFRRGD